MANPTWVQKEDVGKMAREGGWRGLGLLEKIEKVMRQLSKGMGANLDGQIRREKARLLLDIKELDGKVDN
jgi:hypothetical protein